MSVKEVTEKILAEAKAEAEKIKTEAAHNAKQSSEQTDNQLARFDKESVRLSQKAFEEAKSTVLATARMDIAKQKLKFKNAVLDDVFAKAAETIKTMNDADYIGLMKKLMLAVVEKGDEEIVIGKNENRLGSDFVNSLNAELGDRGKLTLADDRADIEAGFILRRGKVRANVGLKVLIAQVKEHLETALAAELFN